MPRPWAERLLEHMRTQQGNGAMSDHPAPELSLIYMANWILPAFDCRRDDEDTRRSALLLRRGHLRLLSLSLDITVLARTYLTVPTSLLVCRINDPLLCL